MPDDRLAARRRVLQAHGAGESTVDELLAYCAKPFEEPSRPAFPLADEPHLDVWSRYVEEGVAEGAFAALRRHFVQLRFPVRAGISQDPAYLDATRKGQGDRADAFAPGLTLADPARLELQVRATIAGRVPVLVVGDRRDFVTLVQAFTERNEPVDVPSSMGACIVNGLNNWDRVAAHRERWARENPDAALTGWGDEFRRMAARKELYQDRFIILSSGPYSAVQASDVEMSDADWLARSLVIRCEHECTHYFTYRVFRSMRNNLFDELIADFVGLVRGVGGYRGDFARRFLGLETFPTIRRGGRLEVYRGGLSDDALPTAASLAMAAIDNLQGLSDRYRASLGDLFVLTGLTYSLSLLTLEELASPGMSALVTERLS